MGDDAQVLDDAVNALEQIKDAYRGQLLGRLASELSHQIAPTMAFDANPKILEKQYTRTAKEFTEEAARAVAKRTPAYQTPIFKCHGDFEKCKKNSTSSVICMALLAICVAKQLIPFAPRT